MAPKKVAPVVEKEETETPLVADKAKPKPIKLVKSLAHPPTLTMVVEVLKNNQEKKGTSVQAIRTRILAAHPTVDPSRLKFLLRTALNRGIEKGILMRPPNSSATGATGRFKLVKPETKPKEASGENVDPNAAPKEKPKKKPAKKVKAAKEDSTGEKAEKKVKAKREKSEEKPKAAASKPKKEAEEKADKGPAPAKKPKAKTAAAAEGGGKAKKVPTKKEEKAESSKLKKDSEESSTAKSSKKVKK